MSSSTIPFGTESEARERVAQGFQHMVEEADQLLQNARRVGQSPVGSACDKLHEVRAGLSHVEEAAVAQARRVAHATDEAVRSHPYAAMGVAAGVGLLLGLLIARR